MPSPTDAWQTSLEAAKANTLASTLAMVEHLNNELKNSYNSRFDSWKIEVEAGKRDNKNPPPVPAGYNAVTGASGFAYPELGSLPVTLPRTDIPADYSHPTTIAVGLLDVINVPLGDPRVTGSVANGAALISQGASAAEVGDPMSIWIKMERGGPFGVWRWYQRI